jgi:hypothetical protein
MVESILRDLEQAASGDDIAYCLSGAFCSLETLLRRGLRITEDERDQLIRGASLAHASALCGLPESCPRRRILIGIEAFVGLVTYAAETDEQRARRHPHLIADMRAYARMFRNDCHNLSLRSEVEERKRKREYSGQSTGTAPSTFRFFGNDGAR